MRPGWARDVRDLCRSAGVPFLFKQWGAYDEAGRLVGKKQAGRILDGRTWDEHPSVAGFYDPLAVGLAEPPPLTDEEWARVAPLLPGREGTPGGTGRDNRAFLDAVRWKAWTLKPWRDLPARFGKWNTAARRAARWGRSGNGALIGDAVGDPLVGRLLS